MTTYTVSAGGIDITEYVQRLDFWTKALPGGIGRFQFLLNNHSGDLTDLFAKDDLVLVEVAGLGNTPFGGYVDIANPKVSESLEAHFDRSFILSGRDVGQDLMNKTINIILNDKGDDIIDALLSGTSSLIQFTSPSTAPIIYHDSKGWTYLIDQVRAILELMEYEGFVFYNDPNPRLSIEAVSSAVSSGITLKAIAGDATNNILKLLDHVESDSYEERNVILVFGPEVDDHWTELNGADWDGLHSGNTTDDYVFEGAAITPTRVTSLGAVKVIKNAGTDLGCKLTFPKYFLTNIDWGNLENGSLSLQAYVHKTSGSPTVWYLGPRIKDIDGNVIRRISGSFQYDSEWKFQEVPIGKDDGWEFETEVSAPFKWGSVREIQVTILPGTTLTNIDYFLLDILKMPQLTYAVANHSGGTCVTCGETFSAVTPKHLPLTRDDIVCQQELEAYAESIADKRDHVISRLKLIADGDAGIISNNWKWRPSYKVTVNVPAADINGQVFRMIDLHHVISDPVNDPQHTVELDLVPYNQVLDHQRWSYGRDGKIALIRRLHEQLKYLENRRGYAP